MAGNGALDLSIRIMGKVDPSLVTAIKQTKGLTGDLASALTGTKSLGSTVANTLGVIGKTGLGIMATLTTASAVMIKKTTSMAEEYQAQAADAVKYVGGIMNDDGSIDPEKRATMEDAILKMTTQVPIKRDEMAQIAASLGQSGKSYEQIFLDNQQTGEKSYLYDTARLAAAWDIDAKSAADYMAKWETAFDKTHNQIIDIADSINYLGGHMSTTAAEIASVVNTSGGVGQTAGVDLHTTSALAATMLAMGVNDGKAGTSLNRVFTNITLGNSATDAQVGAWNKLGFDPVQIAKDMQSTGPNGEDGAASTLYKVFEAISKQDKYQQTATIKTLFGQWAIEGVSKIVGNLPAFQNALLMAGDTSAYSGSMEKELLVRLDTGKAVSQMASNATDRLLINVGNQFLPAKKELTSMWIDIANGITESLPDLSNIVNGILPMLHSALLGIGNAAQAALPWIQKGIDYTAEHGPEVAGAIAAIIGFLKQVATIGVKAVNFIIGALNKIQLTIPETLFGIPVPVIGGKSFGFNLSPVSVPAFANGGMTQGPSIAGEAGPEAVISFRRGVREKNIDTWLTAGKLLGVGLGDLLGLPGRKPKMFADGGFTEEDSNLIDFNRARRQQYYNQVAQSFDTMVQPVAAALVLGSDAGVAFSRITEIANYAVDGLETLAAMPTPTVSDDQGKAQQLLNTGIGKVIAGAKSVLGNENTQKAIRFIRGADAEKAKLEYAANPDNYDLSNVNFFPTAGNSELTRQNLSMLADLQNYQQEVELKPIGGSEDASGGSTGNQRGGSSNSYQRTYTSSSGNTYVYAPNFTIYGSMNAEDLRSIMDEGYEKFCEYVERYEREKRRTQYGT